MAPCCCSSHIYFSLLGEDGVRRLGRQNKVHPACILLCGSSEALEDLRCSSCLSQLGQLVQDSLLRGWDPEGTLTFLYISDQTCLSSAKASRPCCKCYRGEVCWEGPSS